MFKIFLKKSKKLFAMKFSFSLPKKKNILLYDEIHSLILKETIKKDFNILKTRELEIYFWIFLKQMLDYLIASNFFVHVDNHL